MSGAEKVIVRKGGHAVVDVGQRPLSGPVTVRVVEGYAVFDGKEQVTRGTVTIDDPATALLRGLSGSPRWWAGR